MKVNNLNATPRGQRVRISFLGRRNAGKSSLINALTNQEVAIVADLPGTTTDPVEKAMEILPIGPVLLTDTAGIDDTGSLGAKRAEKSLEVLQKTDLILLVLDPEAGFGECEEEILVTAKKRNIPIIGVTNKIDLYPDMSHLKWADSLAIPSVKVSARTHAGIEELLQMIVKHVPGDWTPPTIAGDLLSPGDTVILVIPIDKAAPRGRLILPQQQLIRDVLEHDCIAIMVKERELRRVIQGMSIRPKLVVTDASAYLKAAADTPGNVLFTSFSILFARYKGDLHTLVAGLKTIPSLAPGDKILIAEACTHHPAADDIGRVKIPRWLRQSVGAELCFDIMPGGGPLPENLKEYKLVVHCGACMLNRREMLFRILQAREAGVPMVNYGVLMAYIQGILHRALSPFPEVLALLERQPDLYDEDEIPLRFKEAIGGDNSGRPVFRDS
ncbi:MAG: [FeFe] hydrogenase H-cluster maturation GTPase HydF [Eubacteriales bacterium]|jgi:[FeFe] hydrogenase H-cluster maturation GTPase HydF